MQWTEVASGYRFLEAPRVQGDALWFCDLLEGGLFRLNGDGSTDRFLPGQSSMVSPTSTGPMVFQSVGTIASNAACMASTLVLSRYSLDVRA